ncbi:MAG: N-acetylmuramoyl-L-alanine amidase [Clostridium sp.]
MKKIVAVIISCILLTSCGAPKSEGNITKELSSNNSIDNNTEKLQIKDVAVDSDKGVENKSKTNKYKYTICIDPGHQSRGMTQKEAYAPGSSKKKDKVSSGATGVVTKTPEYKLNLQVSLILKTKLEEEGYRVVMTRETNDVSLSNIDRANIGNDNNANLVVRVHADSNESSSVTGSSILYPSGEYTKNIQEESYKAAKSIENKFKEHTGSKSRGVVPRDDMTGFNWSNVPTVIVEMGFLSNPREDKLMGSLEYQNKMATGIFNGVVGYINR